MTTSTTYLTKLITGTAMCALLASPALAGPHTSDKAQDAKTATEKVTGDMKDAVMDKAEGEVKGMVKDKANDMAKDHMKKTKHVPATGHSDIGGKAATQEMWDKKKNWDKKTVSPTTVIREPVPPVPTNKPMMTAPAPQTSAQIVNCPAGTTAQPNGSCLITGDYNY